MKLQRSITGLVATGLVLTAAIAASQQEKPKGQALNPDVPGLVHKRLGDLAGTWDVTVRYIMGDKENLGKATCEAKLILDGRFLQQDYTSRFQGQPYHVMQLLGYDNTRKEIDRDQAGQLRHRGLAHRGDRFRGRQGDQ